jgi:hypothetical protein
MHVRAGFTGRLMKISLVRCSVGYELTFPAPLFELPGRLTTVLAKFYHALAPTFRVPARDLEAFSGTSMADIRMRIRLSNEATIELLADRFNATFGGVQPSHLRGMSPLIALIRKALNEAIPELQVASTRYRFSGWFSADGGRDSVLEYLRGSLSRQGLFSSVGHGLTPSAYSIRTSLESKDERWEVSLLVEPSYSPGSDFFLEVALLFGDGSKYVDHQQMNELSEKIFPSLFKELNIDILNI